MSGKRNFEKIANSRGLWKQQGKLGKWLGYSDYGSNFYCGGRNRGIHSRSVRLAVNNTNGHQAKTIVTVYVKRFNEKGKMVYSLPQASFQKLILTGNGNKASS